MFTLLPKHYSKNIASNIPAISSAKNSCKVLETKISMGICDKLTIIKNIASL